MCHSPLWAASLCTHLLPPVFSQWRRVKRRRVKGRRVKRRRVKITRVDVMFAGRWCQFRLHTQRTRLVTMHEAVKEQPKLRKAWISRVNQLASSHSASTLCVHVAESSCFPVPCCTMIGRREGGVIFRVIPEWDNRFCLKMDASFCCCVRLSLQLSCSNCGLARLIFFHSPTLPFSDSLSLMSPSEKKRPTK